MAYPWNCRFCGKELTSYPNTSVFIALNCKSCRINPTDVGAPTDAVLPSKSQILVASKIDQSEDEFTEVIAFEDIVVDIHIYDILNILWSSASIYQWRYVEPHNNLICNAPPITTPLVSLDEALDPSNMEEFQKQIKLYLVFQ